VTQLLHGEHAVHVDELLEMSGYPLEFLEYVAAEGGSDFDMMTAEIELHDFLLSLHTLDMLEPYART